MSMQTQIRDRVNPMLFANQTSLIDYIKDFLQANGDRNIENATRYDIDRFRKDTTTDKDLLENIRQYLGTRNSIESITDEEIADYVGGESLDDYMNNKEVMERWLVDSWLCQQLADRGQPILETGYGTRWGRTCTGQAVFLDSVIQDIYEEVKTIGNVPTENSCNIITKEKSMNPNQILLLTCGSNLLSVSNTIDNGWETALFQHGVWDIYEGNYVDLFKDCKTWDDVLFTFMNIRGKKSFFSNVK